MTTMMFGNKARSLRTKQSEHKLDRFARVLLHYDILLLTTAYAAYAVHFVLGQFPNMDIMLLLLSPLFVIELLHFQSRSV